MNMVSKRVLVVDDEPSIRSFLRASLSSKFTILEAASGKEALVMAATGSPDIILLDLGLPDMDGVTITRDLRGWTKVPIIIISVRDQESEKIAALDAGADDYLTKPFGVGELLARMRATWRRQADKGSDPVFQQGDLTVDLAQHSVRMKDQEVQLTPTEYGLLSALVSQAGKVITNQQLLRQVWGEGYEDLHILRVNISNLRHKIEPDPARPTYIQTEPGVGYRIRV